jgi:hypothetical protein
MSSRPLALLLSIGVLTLTSSLALAQPRPRPQPGQLEYVSPHQTPNCCGQSCDPRGQDQCCPGTVCSRSGRCIPDDCAECGGRGCRVDYTTCTAECGAPGCCLQDCVRNVDCCPGTQCRDTSPGRSQCVPEACDECPYGCSIGSESCDVECRQPGCCHDECVTDGDCCAGTRCQTTSGNVRRCMPIECDRCTGMHPYCRASSTCEVECLPPRSCGDPCESDTDCGTGTFCRRFSSGNARCVPHAFDRLCRECGSTCAFDNSDCEAVCPDR